MNTEAITEIVEHATIVYRKGEELTVTERPNGQTVVEIFGYPHVSESPTPTTDMVFLSVGFTDDACVMRKELLRAIGDGIGPETEQDWHKGPSYIVIGADLGEQDLALRFMALCQHVGISKVITPKMLGFDDPEQALTMAGMGCLLIDGIHD
jgi:hypothetical protein